MDDLLTLYLSLFSFFSDRHQLVQQIQLIGGGALGQPAATAVRHVAAQNGVWSLGNFGGVPPKSAMMYHAPDADAPKSEEVSGSESGGSDGNILPNKIVDSDYRHVFNACGVGMVRNSPSACTVVCHRASLSRVSLFCIFPRLDR
jgi:hypothetical protein